MDPLGHPVQASNVQSKAWGKCVSSPTLDAIWPEKVFTSRKHYSLYKLVCLIELGPTEKSKRMFQPSFIVLNIFNEDIQKPLHTPQ